MKKSVLFTACLALICSMNIMAQVGTWRSYMSYQEPQQILKHGNTLYVRASNSLYSYNLNDQSITTYDKVRQLNDSYITHIALNKETKNLLIVYQNQNMDVLDCTYDDVENISALYLKSMTEDKTVNDVCIYGRYAYLATGFGVVKVNMKKIEIAESYILGANIKNIGISNNDIYLRTSKDSILTAELTANLIDPHNWINAESAPAGVFNKDLTDWNEYIETVKTLKPGGPKSNHFGFMQYLNNRLYTCSGGDYPGAIQVKEGDDWIIYQDTNLNAITGLNAYYMVSALAVDPKDPNHVYAGVVNGLYEFQDGQLVAHYDHKNSPISMHQNKYEEIQIISGVVIDNNGYLWCLNSQAQTASLVRMNMSTKEWESADLPELMRLPIQKVNHSLGNLINMIVDRNGYIWFINDHYQLDSFYCLDPETMKFVSYFEDFHNQDGTTISDYRPHCLVEDLKGNLWLGTKVGPFVIDQENLYTKDTYLTQVKVPRNDGTNFADYLLAGINTSCMAIDGANRKWFGTNGAGVYLVSSDNTKQLQYFTQDNSPLLSNNISSIAIDHETGEVFFGTDQGLCSYMSDAIQVTTSMDKNNVYAYPNPVVSSYNGLITVVGLTMDADVKILSTSGQLVAEGRSNGGMFTWNGRDRSGKRVASGVYMVATANSDGSKGTVCKIAVVN